MTETDFHTIMDSSCDAWNGLIAEPRRITYLTDYSYMQSGRIL
jgi:hypothetical protein